MFIVLLIILVLQLLFYLVSVFFYSYGKGSQSRLSLNLTIDGTIRFVRSYYKIPRHDMHLQAMLSFNCNKWIIRQGNVFCVAWILQLIMIAAPNDANVYIGRLEDRFVYHTQSYNLNIHWISFIMIYS